MRNLDGAKRDQRGNTAAQLGDALNGCQPGRHAKSYGSPPGQQFRNRSYLSHPLAQHNPQLRSRKLIQVQRSFRRDATEKHLNVAISMSRDLIADHVVQLLGHALHCSKVPQVDNTMRGLPIGDASISRRRD